MATLTENASAEVEQERVPDASIDLQDPSLYINRELSWIEFNQRVLDEALDARHPLLERVKFLSIFSSNLDEFFMIRVSGIKDQIAAGVINTPPDGMSPMQQLQEIRARVIPQLVAQRKCWHEELSPALKAAGIQIADYDRLSSATQAWLRD